MFLQRVLVMPEDLAPWRTVLFRLSLVAVLLAVLIVILWLDRAGLKDHAGGDLTVLDIIYFTMVTITTVGYGDIVPITPRARIIDAFVVTPVRIFVWLLFLGTAYQLAIKQFAEGYRMVKLKASLYQHCIVCGVGHTGLAAIKELLAKGTHPEQILAVDIRENRVRMAVKLGVIAIQGDATQEATLQDAVLAKAKSLIVATDRDDTNTLILLTVRHLNPTVRVLVSAKEEENVKILRQAGANAIISPARFGGFLLASAIDASYVAQYMEDLLTAGGRVDLIQETITTQDSGKRATDFLPDLLLRVYRSGTLLSFQDQDRLEEGDEVLLLKHLPHEA